MESCSTTNYLGWNIKITSIYMYISLKAYRSLHLIYRTISPSAPVNLKKQLYLALVRGQLIYGLQLWRPHLMKDIKGLEWIQCRATKFRLKDYCLHYKFRLALLNILPNVLARITRYSVPYKMLKGPFRQLQHSNFSILCASQH